MILYNTFNNLCSKLSNKLEQKLISKYKIAIDQKSEIDVLVVTDNKISKTDFVDDNILDNYFNFSLFTTSELEEDFYYSELFKNKNEIIDYKTSRRKLKNLLDPKPSKMPSVPVVTFYSYKGGMGRSTHLMLTATYLAKKHGKKIVIIDCDFEAPGFTNFFLEVPEAKNYKDGLIEYFTDKPFDDSIFLNPYSWEVSKEFSGDGEIRIIPAGNLNPESLFDNNQPFMVPLETYLESLSRFDLSSTEYVVNQFSELINDIKKQYNPDAVFIDSRTGFTDVFGIAGLQMASQVVGFFSNSIQNEPGLVQFTNAIQELIKNKKNFSTPIFVNSFSDSNLFEEFKQKHQEIIMKNDFEEDFSLTPYYSYFDYNSTLSKIGTSAEDKIWITKIERGYEQGYTDVADKILEFISSNLNELPQEIEGIENKEITSETELANLQEIILTKLQQNWPDLYADGKNGEKVDFQKEFDERKIFYRESMRDIFNFNKFIVLGNKGTGKTYLFQALKNKDIVLALKNQSQKTNLNVQFVHLVDKVENYFIQTNFFESYKNEIEQIGDFYSKFWKVYTWKSITEQINKKNIIQFNPFEAHFEILPDDNGNAKNIIDFIKNIDNIIAIERDLNEIDKLLNSKQIDLVAIYDNLDLMVEPNKWKSEMAALINFWQFVSYKRIHCKLFLRSDLYKKIVGINNIQSLKNNTISIEWDKNEIFNYFYNIVKRSAKEYFITAVDQFDFRKISNDDIIWKEEFKKKFRQEKQNDFEEPILRKLCWVFFGQYPDKPAHGESYDWLYKNVMNADETISIRPFLDLIKISIDNFIKAPEQFKDSSVILPKRYYTYNQTRKDAVIRHFDDLVVEKGNEPLRNIFDFIDKNTQYQFYELFRNELVSLLESVIKKDSLKETVDELEDLLIITGIIKQVTNQKYSFAFLYKYRLGLKSRKVGRRK
ncbi:MinD-like ATPase involved in chromosome partitioning or flagellar assembly [Chryseobacterium sp. SLBN-27]|uniref:KGGVGR-motif variant AAA ATPase n=1 Tax=Chryseobacterium sp. SLBN-27 TaxID=3042287 RepID=UPI002854D585|nr:AAA family ATPase [Chryseobacterium sp. SLBN-27]MDR6158075.1 MinD-like ATPase involved in chromosome partitioning or flagellar assembly [Chryseobacterium sp. SLBN-27]